MDLVLYFQNISSVFLSFLFSIFDLFSSIDFSIFVFAILFLIVDKKVGFKYFLSVCFGFLFGSVFLKNVVKRPRPYEMNKEIITDRSCYSFSFPSNSTILAGSNAFYTINSAKINLKNGNINKAIFSTLTFFVFIYGLLVGIAKIYFADNYLLDVIAGLIIGGTISYLIFKFVKVSTKTVRIFATILGVFCLGLIAFFAYDLICNNFSNSIIFEFCGLCLSVLIGCLIEKKYINYKIKNNLIIVLLKTLIIVILFIANYFLSLVLPGVLFVLFFKNFIFGLVVTALLPIIFKTIQKYCFVFSNKVEEKRVVKSFIVLSEKSTIKACKQISKFVKSGDCFLLEGDLGAGKSFVVRHLLKQFGVSKRITSPTFTLFNDYKAEGKHFYHFDLYRLEDEDEVVNIGFEEIIEDNKSIKFIEWPDKAKKYMPKKYKKITILKLGKTARNIVLEDYTF